MNATREKVCFKCDRLLPISSFYRHSQMADGHLGKCKECARTDVRANYYTRREQYIAYERRRAKTEHRKKQQLLVLQKMRREHPERSRARAMVSRAISRGLLARGLCEVCGAKAEAHHDDYARPLDVRWLCSTHHKSLHRKLKVSSSGKS